MPNHVHNAIKFIRKYREFEKKPLDSSLKEVKYIFQNDHLVNSWGGRQRNFGDFYLNLSHTSQYRFLEYWQLPDEEAEDYVRKMAEDEMAMIWVDPPIAIYLPHQLLKFFYNHGIDRNALGGIELTNLPADDKCYGNSGNWADYILSLPMDIQEEVVEAIQREYIGNV